MAVLLVDMMVRMTSVSVVMVVVVVVFIMITITREVMESIVAVVVVV